MDTLVPPPPPYARNPDPHLVENTLAPIVPPAQPQNRPVRPLIPPQTPSTAFELSVQVSQPAKRVRAPNGKVKTVKVDPISVGPTNFTTHISWEDFISGIADLLKCQPNQLSLGSLEWHWLKPVNSPWLPLQNSTGLTSMLNKVTACKTAPYVIVRMEAPKANVQVQSLPWAPSTVVDTQADEDQLSDDIGPTVKKARLDDELEDVAERIAEKYSVGLCKVHPDIHCLHHRASDLHFDLDRPRRLVWAAAIIQGKATYDKVPLGSNFFKANQALKKPGAASKGQAVSLDQSGPTPLSSASTLAPPPTPAAALAPVHAPASPFNFNPYMFMPFNPFASMPMASTNPWGFPLPATQPTTPSRTHDNNVEPPSSPISVDCDIAAWCTRYRLNEEAEAGLERLGFAVGDDLTAVTEKEYTDAGFKPLGWKRVLKAHRRWCRDHKKN